MAPFSGTAKTKGWSPRVTGAMRLAVIGFSVSLASVRSEVSLPSPTRALSVSSAGGRSRPLAPPGRRSGTVRHDRCLGGGQRPGQAEPGVGGAFELRAAERRQHRQRELADRGVGAHPAVAGLGVALDARLADPQVELVEIEHALVQRQPCRRAQLDRLAGEGAGEVFQVDPLGLAGDLQPGAGGEVERPLLLALGLGGDAQVGQRTLRRQRRRLDQHAGPAEAVEHGLGVEAQGTEGVGGGGVDRQAVDHAEIAADAAGVETGRASCLPAGVDKSASRSILPVRSWPCQGRRAARSAMPPWSLPDASSVARSTSTSPPSLVDGPSSDSPVRPSLWPASL